MQLLSNNELAQRVRLSTVTIWRFRRRYPDFPKPIFLNGGTQLRWVSSEFDAWFLSRRQNDGERP